MCKQVHHELFVPILVENFQRLLQDSQVFLVAPHHQRIKRILAAIIYNGLIVNQVVDLKDGGGCRVWLCEIRAYRLLIRVVSFPFTDNLRDMQGKGEEVSLHQVDLYQLERILVGIHFFVEVARNLELILLKKPPRSTKTLMRLLLIKATILTWRAGHGVVDNAICFLIDVDCHPL